MKPLIPPDSLPKEFSAAELRYMLDVSPGRIGQLETGGIIRRVRPGFYASDAVRNYINFLRRSDERVPKDWQEIRAEIGRERIALMKLERGKLEGTLLEKDSVRQMNLGIVTTVKSKLLALPRKVAPRLLNIKQPAQAEQVVYANIVECLEQLAALAEPGKRA
jgi:hypothetical protein